MSELESSLDNYDNGTAASGSDSLFKYENEVQPSLGNPQQNISRQDLSNYVDSESQNAIQQAIDPTTSSINEEQAKASEANQGMVDPELIFEGNAEKAGKSLVAGVGVVVNDIGNMMDYAAMTLLPDEVRKSDTFRSIVERLPSRFFSYKFANSIFIRRNES